MRQGSGLWVPVLLALMLVAGRWLPGDAGEAWARAGGSLVGANWLDRPQVVRWLEQVPGGGWLQVAVLGRAPAGDAGAGGAGVPGGSMPALGPLAPVAPDPTGAEAAAGVSGAPGAGNPGEGSGGGAAPALQGSSGSGDEPGGAAATGAGLPGTGSDEAGGATGDGAGGGSDSSTSGGNVSDPSGAGEFGAPAADPAAPGSGAGSAAGGAGSSRGEDWEPRWNWPVTGRVSEPFGWQLDDGDAPRFHEGIDIAAPAGTAVRAAAGGVVSRVWYDRAGLGWMVEVDHGGGWVTRYAVVDHVVVRDRDAVTAGQVVAAVAAEGEGGGPHLHFEMRRRSQAVDPGLHLPPAGGS